LIVRALVAAGVHSVMSFQLFTHGTNTCALNLFGFAARAFDPSLQVLQVLTGPDDEIRRCAGNTPFHYRSPISPTDTPNPCSREASSASLSAARATVGASGLSTRQFAARRRY